MILAIQDADVLGELNCLDEEKGTFDNQLLKWYERVRMPRAKFLLGLSHLSALAYSFPYPWWRRIRMKSIEQMERDPYLHVKQTFQNQNSLNTSLNVQKIIHGRKRSDGK